METRPLYAHGFVAAILPSCCAGIAVSLLAATIARGEKPADLRAQFLAGPMRDVEEIVFAARSILYEHWYANIGYWAADRCRPMYGKFGKLCKLNLRTGKLTLLIDDPQGGVRDPAVHYDGKRILFSYRKGGTENYLLHIINCRRHRPPPHHRRQVRRL